MSEKSIFYILSILVKLLFYNCNEDPMAVIRYQSNNCDCQIAEEGEFSSLRECEENCIYDCSGTITDIEGNEYSIITIGDQCWMAENLRVSLYRNGDTIPNIKEKERWVELTSGAWCWFENDPMYDSIYGKMYNGYAVNDTRGICPKGWRVPSEQDWLILDQNVEEGGLKEMGFEHWMTPNEGASNSSGFTALPAGLRHGANGHFSVLGTTGAWFELNDQPEGDIIIRVLKWYTPRLSWNTSKLNREGACIRCMRDI